MAEPVTVFDPATVDLEIVHLLVLLQQEMEASARATLLADLGRRFNRIGDFDRGRAALEDAASLAPGDPNAARSLGLAMFGEGRWAEGLALYDSVRWGLKRYEKYFRAFPFPVWQGGPVEGRKMLLWAEQGIGDQVMQARVIGPLLERGAAITVEADPRMAPLIERTWPGVTSVTQTVSLPKSLIEGGFDHQSSLFSAWRWVDLDRPQPAYLKPDPGLVDGFRRAWANQGWGLNVGISWRSKAAASGGPRTLAEDMLRPLIQNRSVTFHSLQYGADTGEVAALSKRLGRAVYMDRDSDPLKDIDRQAAQIAALDLVISIDNATIHLAGAIGTECWVLMPRGADWRWGALGRETPLYESLRLFRADQSGLWSAVIADVVRELSQWVAGRAP